MSHTNIENIQTKLNYFYESNNIPHIIFYGCSGSGKKTLLFDFLHRIYDNNQKAKTNTMIVNCAHGKGIKFIREELKTFAKSNLKYNSKVNFKSIVLLNADSLTTDAQSALRRCIELFSYNTRFFIVVEDKERLLNPILSRFCEIYVPKSLLNYETSWYDFSDFTTWLSSHPSNILTDIFDKKSISYHDLIDFSHSMYSAGYSCLDLIHYIKKKGCHDHPREISNILFLFYDVKSTLKHERFLIFCILDNLRNIYRDGMS